MSHPGSPIASSTSTPSSPEKKSSLIQQFFDFLKAFGIIGLAIAFVIGQTSSQLVTAFVNDIINPFIGLFIPSGNLDTMSLKISSYSGNISEFKYGHLISNAISFLIIAFIIFIAYKEMTRLKLLKGNEDITKAKFFNSR